MPKEKKPNISNTILITICTVFSIIWSVKVILFLFNDQIIPDIHHVVRMCIFITLSTLGSAGILNFIFSGIKSNTAKYFLTLFLFTIAYAILVLFSPYSPAHDSLDLHLILNAMLTGKFSGTYYESYMNFFATNKLAVYIYYPFVSIAQSVEPGIRTANALFLWISSVGISLICYRTTGIKAAMVSFMLLIFLFPALLFSGPYIYPPAIMLCSLSMAFYTHKSPFVKVFGYLFAGILFTLRPLALGAFLVYITVSGLSGNSKKFKIFHTVSKTALILFVCFVTQWYIGKVMFLTSTHVFNNLESSMFLWTLDVSTRNEGDLTGLNNHNPSMMSDDEIKDEILRDFHALWSCYANPKANHDEITNRKNNISKNLKDRIKFEILNNKENFDTYIKRKFTNYYRDYYKPYFYTININRSDASELLFKNYDYKYFLYENVLLVLFHLTASVGALFTCINMYARKNRRRSGVTALILFFGVICTSITSILFTEVGKRLIFDSFIPMCIVISINLINTCEMFTPDKKKRKNKLPLLTGIIAATVGITGIYTLNKESNIEFFKDCNIIINEHRDVTIKLKKPVDEEGYIFTKGSADFKDMKGLSELNVEYMSDDYLALPSYFCFINPGGQPIYVSYFE